MNQNWPALVHACEHLPLLFSATRLHLFLEFELDKARTLRSRRTKLFTKRLRATLGQSTEVILTRTEKAPQDILVGLPNRMSTAGTSQDTATRWQRDPITHHLSRPASELRRFFLRQNLTNSTRNKLDKSIINETLLFLRCAAGILNRPHCIAKIKSTIIRVPGRNRGSP